MESTRIFDGQDYSFIRCSKLYLGSDGSVFILNERNLYMATLSSVSSNSNASIRVKGFDLLSVTI